MAQCLKPRRRRRLLRPQLVTQTATASDYSNKDRNPQLQAWKTELLQCYLWLLGDQTLLLPQSNLCLSSLNLEPGFKDLFKSSYPKPPKPEHAQLEVSTFNKHHQVPQPEQQTCAESSLRLSQTRQREYLSRCEYCPLCAMDQGYQQRNYMSTIVASTCFLVTILVHAQVVAGRCAGLQHCLVWPQSEVLWLGVVLRFS